MQLRPLHPDFGVEVQGFEPLCEAPPRAIEELRAAFDQHQLLLFRGGQRIPPARQVEISGWFGPVVSNAADGRPWTVLHNEDAGGRVRLPFHSDLSYTDSPIQGLSLHALELPAGGSTTSFISGRHAWSRLSAQQQAQLAPMTLRHRLASQLFGEWPEFIADHPLRLLHPRTGLPVLYVTEHHAQRIHELSAAESERVLAQLFEHLYAPERVYTHCWEPYDLVIWDNLAIQHARREEAVLAGGSRAMQRVALSDVPFAELVERARRAQRHEQLI
jgi:taurine dioxygenase